MRRGQVRKRPSYFLQDNGSESPKNSNSLIPNYNLHINYPTTSLTRSSSMTGTASIPNVAGSDLYRRSNSSKFPHRLLTSPRRSYSTGNIMSSSSSSSSSLSLSTNTPSNAVHDIPDHNSVAALLVRTARSALHIPHHLSKIIMHNYHHQALQKSHRYQYIYYKSKPILHSWYKLLRLCILELSSIRCTCRQKLACLFVVVIYSSCYVYFLQMPKWEYEMEWKQWEIGMQQSVTKLMPPSVSPSNVMSEMKEEEEEETIRSKSSQRRSQQLRTYWDSNESYLMQFPHLMQKDFLARNHAVPVPDYEWMGRIRTTLAQRLRDHAIQSCENGKQQYPQQSPLMEEKDNDDAPTQYSLPVMGITVANDTPENRYLRRILHTIDLNTVGSIVITWYDELTEAQIVGNQPTSLSHDVVASALNEFIDRTGFEEISWRDTKHVNMSQLRLADITTLTMLSQIAISVQQFCTFADAIQGSEGFHKKTDACRNELVLLRFSTNLGCSTGVNNPLFTHPTAPHWLIANYDIAYPSGVLNAMGKELKKTREKYPDLAVHTYGYIYGRGKIENPWSNFVMTSCAVASAGVWDENIFPAYYEDDDYRDRIRYINGIWKDVVGDPDRYENVPQQLMMDSHLIRYQTDRNVSVAHGPLSAQTYLSGTHETMKKVQDAEDDEKNLNAFQKLWLWIRPDSKKPPDPLHYESERWSLAKEVSNAEGFFRCKHGALPDAGTHGEDPLRYFSWHERFLVPFVNRTRLTRMKESMFQLNKSEIRSQQADGTASNNSHSSNPSPWAVWNFNATRRQCVHDAVNALLAMPPSEEKKNLTQEYKDLCSVC